MDKVKSVLERARWGVVWIFFGYYDDLKRKLCEPKSIDNSWILRKVISRRVKNNKGRKWGVVLYFS